MEWVARETMGKNQAPVNIRNPSMRKPVANGHRLPIVDSVFACYGESLLRENDAPR